jgi:hypothetical protein
VNVRHVRYGIIATDTNATFPLMERHMFGKAIQSGMAEPSFFYLMMAATCFRRAACTRYPNAGGALRDIGREYPAMAGRVVPTHGCLPISPYETGGLTLIGDPVMRSESS